MESRLRAVTRVAVLIGALGLPWAGVGAAAEPVEGGEPPAKTEERAEEPAEEEPAAPSAAELREAAEAAAEAAGEPEARPPAEPAESKTRNLNRLNPEISFTGDFVGLATDGGAPPEGEEEAAASDEDFDIREFELDLQSELDPFSRAKLTIAFSPEEGVDIEEGYVRWDGLGRGLSLTAGKFRQQLGVINRWHLHALPQVDYPLALAALFGEEGLAQTGFRLAWLLPRPWAHANELTVEVTDGENEAFGGESFDRLVGLVHLKNYWDLNDATYLEWGLSAVDGRAAGGLANRVVASDLTLHWQPPARAKYREITWRSEVFRSQRDDEFGVEQESWSGYSYLEALLKRNLYAGVRFDQVEDPLVPQLETQGVLVNLSWWQSEYVRIRGEYGHLDHSPGDDEDRFVLQLTWAAGPHKHENY